MNMPSGYMILDSHYCLMWELRTEIAWLYEKGEARSKHAYRETLGLYTAIKVEALTSSLILVLVE